MTSFFLSRSQIKCSNNKGGGSEETEVEEQNQWICVILRCFFWDGNTKDEKNNIWLISKTGDWSRTPTIFIRRHNSWLMRSGKTSKKNNVNCCDHELIPACSCLIKELFISHPDKLLRHNIPGRQDQCVWRYRMKTRPALFLFCLLLLLSSSSSSSHSFPSAHVCRWCTDKSSLSLQHTDGSVCHVLTVTSSHLSITVDQPDSSITEFLQV